MDNRSIKKTVWDKKNEIDAIQFHEQYKNGTVREKLKFDFHVSTHQSKNSIKSIGTEFTSSIEKRNGNSWYISVFPYGWKHVPSTDGNERSLVVVLHYPEGCRMNSYAKLRLVCDPKLGMIETESIHRWQYEESVLVVFWLTNDQYDWCMANRTISLKTNLYFKHWYPSVSKTMELSRSFWFTFNDKSTTDATIACADGILFHVHKAVLKLRCPFLYEAVRGPLQPHFQLPNRLPDRNRLEDCLKYIYGIYRPPLVMSQSTMQGLIEYGDYLKISGIKTIAESHLVQYVNSECTSKDFGQQWENYADMYNLPYLKEITSQIYPGSSHGKPVALVDQDPNLGATHHILVKLNVINPNLVTLQMRRDKREKLYKEYLFEWFCKWIKSSARTIQGFLVPPESHKLGLFFLDVNFYLLKEFLRRNNVSARSERCVPIVLHDISVKEEPAIENIEILSNKADTDRATNDYGSFVTWTSPIGLTKDGAISDSEEDSDDETVAMSLGSYSSMESVDSKSLKWMLGRWIVNQMDVTGLRECIQFANLKPGETWELMAGQVLLLLSTEFDGFAFDNDYYMQYNCH